jgi:hypothetical protein
MYANTAIVKPFAFSFDRRASGYRVAFHSFHLCDPLRYITLRLSSWRISISRSLPDMLTGLLKASRTISCSSLLADLDHQHF